MHINDLIAIISKIYKQKVGIAPAKTKLLKLAYLAEVYFTRLTGKKLTNQEWIFWKYGPYFWNYDEIISNETIFTRLDKTDDFFPVEVRENYRSKELPMNEYNAIIRALDHSDDDLNKILDFVYFDTEPMMKARSRGEKLDFKFVMPEKYYEIKKCKVDKQHGDQIIKKIRKWEMRKKGG